MSIRKMTFSLASLILILALGLVLAPTSVMADTATADNIGADNPEHTGLSAGDPHNAHPKPVISLKQVDDKAKDDEVVIVADDGDANNGVENQFTLIIDYGQPIAGTAAERVPNRATNAVTIAGTDFSGLVLDANGANLGTGITNLTFATAAAVTMDDESTTVDETLSQFEVTFTVAADALPDGLAADGTTAAPNLNEVSVRIRLGSVASAFSLETLPDDALTAIPGGRSVASDVYTFTLVKTLTEQIPNVMIAAETGATVDDVFDVTFTFGEPEPGADAFKKEHITVTGGQVTDGPTRNTNDTEVWTATISPVLNATSVSVGVADTFAKGDAEDVTATTPPTVMIEVPPTATVDAPFTVTLTFSKDVALVAADLMVTGGEAGTPMPETPNAAMDMVWTVEISPILNATRVEVGVMAAKATGTAQTVTATTPETEMMLANNAYAVVVRSKSRAQASGYFGTATPTLIEWAAMPNLHQLFIQNTATGGGGSLQMIAKNAADENLGARKVVFSEIMWAIDERKAGSDADDDDQWFEILNRSGAAIPVSGISFMGQEGRPELSEGTDRVSNVVGGGERWIRTKGQNGNSGVPTATAGVRTGEKEFISMYRNNYGEPGHQSSRWTKSTQLYKPNHRGTPGMKEAAGAKTFAASGVALTVVFNEIANYEADSGVNKGHEWIELRTRSGDPNFENWLVHIVDEASADRRPETNPRQRQLFKLPKLDTGRFDDILLITKKDPATTAGHPLAAGYNVQKKFEDQDRQGKDKNIKYYVAADWTIDLPDSGNFVLILRNGSDKTNHEKIQDIAGYHPDLTVNRADFFSGLWPLIGYPKPNLTHNKIEKGQVAKRVFDDIPGTRTKDGDKIDKVAFRHDNNTWTGIGYKRKVTPSNQHGGTPGYPNNAQRAGNDAAALAAVIVSEVMPSQGARNLSEWIELRNVSDTIGVNVNGWRITIQNHDEDGNGGTFSGKLSEVINLEGNARIPPGQTLLIAARGGRDETQLPKDRIKIVGKKRTEVLINPYGFTIKVESKKDNNYHLVDMVGNLGTPASTRGNAASLVPIAWELPATTNEDGNRVSIIRVSNKSTGALDGTMRDGWASFEGSAQEAGTLDKTYYGHSTDLGSPGHTIGGVLPVSLSKFRPERMKDTGQIVIRWVTESELNNAGFNILRGEKLDGEFTKINTKLIAGQGTTSERTAYTYTDTSAKPNVVYYYQIQDVSLDGQVTTLRTTHLRGNVTAVGKATTTWGDIKALQ